MNFFDESTKHRLEQVLIGATIFTLSNYYKDLADNPTAFYLDAFAAAGSSLITIGLLPFTKSNFNNVDNKYLALVVNTLLLASTHVTFDLAFLNLSLDEALYSASTKSVGYTAACLFSNAIG